jgi:hypothetical protein
LSAMWCFGERKSEVSPYSCQDDCDRENFAHSGLQEPRGFHWRSCREYPLPRGISTSAAAVAAVAAGVRRVEVGSPKTW